jgi:uncharacterized membrane protein
MGPDGRDRAQYLAQALQEAGIEVEVRSSGGVPTSRDELNRFDALILSDEPAMTSVARQERVRDYVRLAGGGLVMLGGPDSYGLGGYLGSPIEEALPLSMDVRKKRQVASVAIAIVIDSSGSMAMRVEGQTKLALAIEGAIATLDLLREGDDLGVFLVDTRALSLTRSGGSDLVRIIDEHHKTEVRSMLRRADHGGGGIYTFEGLRVAYEALAQRPAVVKHVILFADGSDAEQQQGCELLARQRRQQEKMTLSVISLGDGSDTPFLKRLAEAGGGQFYLAKSATVLPRIFTKDTMLVARNALVEGRVLPRLSSSAMMLEGIDWAEVRPLLGYNLATPKERAELLLVADRVVDWGDGQSERTLDPILARWRYGLGKAICFTSDAKNRWASEWIGWQGFKPFWVQTIRWVMRREQHGNFGKQLEIRGTEGKVVVDARDDQDRLYHGLELEAVIQPPEGAPETIPLREVGPGLYEGRFAAREDGTYFATIQQESAEGPQMVGIVGGVRTYADEYRRLEPDPFMLQRLASLGGGWVANDATRIFERDGARRYDRQAIWPWLLVLALLLFFCDICARRLVIPERAVAIAGEVVERLRPRRPRQAIHQARRDATRRVRIEAVRGEDLPVRTMSSTESDSTPQPDEPVAIDEVQLGQRLAEARRRAQARQGDA